MHIGSRPLRRDHSAVRPLPSGTVTLLFTDVEGSTTLLHEHGDAYADLLHEHRHLLRESFARHGGVEVDTQGDAFFYAFARAGDAVGAAREGQKALEATPVRVRMGIHTGEPLVTDEGYVGVDVHRGARIAAAGHGGQVILSQTTRDLLDGDVELRDLGEHRLKDLSAPQRLYQLGVSEFPPLQTLHQANLPVQLTPLVGRERELAAASDLLLRHRLVTFVGPGGSGKTRLALQVAAEAVEEFEHGVWWVSLASLEDSDLVETAIAQAVGAKQELDDHLRSQKALLLLDNFEHLLPAAPRVAELLREARDVKVLATSRAPLHLAGEQEFPVPPLREDEALELFSERARAIRPGFRPDEHVATICRRLDRLPLALELAAARVKVLPPAKLAERLERALPLLTGGTRDAPERQRTLRLTIEWSYSLLDQHEQRLFAQVAVFPGSFSLEAAEQVCSATLDLLHGLVDKNLLRETGAARFFLLETVREFALERLDDGAQVEPMRRRHAEFFLGVAEDAEPRLNHASVLAALGEDDANFRAALSYGRERAPDLMLRLVGSLWRFWFYRGRYSEGRRWVEQALAHDRGGSSLERAHALRGLAALLVSDDDRVYARSLVEEAIIIHREHGDDAGLARCLNNLGVILLGSSVDPDLDRAAEVLEESLVLGRQLTERGHHFPVAFQLGNLADISLRRGDLAEARRRTNEELEVARAEGDDVNIADAGSRLAWLAALEGDYEEAARLLRRPLRFSVEIGAQWPGGALGLAGLVGAHRGHRTEAAKLLGALDARRGRLGFRGWEDSKDGAIVAMVRELDEDGLAWALAGGQELSFEELLELALRLID
jgi:predicted ATPase/class 3 adenylate cyclase